MGESKRKQTLFQRPALTDSDRMKMLGSDYFEATYRAVFGMVEFVYGKLGGIEHQLIGLDMEAGAPTGMTVTLIRRIEDVPRLREDMLNRWPMVAHVFECWAAPDASVAPSLHPQRFDALSIMLNTSDSIAAANCRVYPAEKRIERGALLFPNKVMGRLGRDLGPHPSAH